MPHEHPSRSPANERLPELPESIRIDHERLRRGGSAEIDLAAPPLLDKESVYAHTGIDAPMIAGVQAGESAYTLYDTRQSRYVTTPFLITASDYRLGQETGYKGVRSQQELRIGRSYNSERFQKDPQMSREHFSVLYNAETGRLTVFDLNSRNGTYVSGRVVDDGDFERSQASDGRDVFAEYTVNVEEELARRRNYGRRDTESPYGYYHNYRIIGRNSQSVAGGVDGTPQSQFVVVDDKSETVREVVADFMERLGGSQRNPATVTPDKVLDFINRYTQKTLRYDLKGVDRLSSPHYGNQGLIELSEYIERGIGVCRHQALLSALLTEAAIKQGYLVGSVGVERNHDLAADGAHAWAVLRSDKTRDDDVIIDAAQNYVGSRLNARRDPHRWRYYLPVDDRR